VSATTLHASAPSLTVSEGRLCSATTGEAITVGLPANQASRSCENAAPRSSATCANSMIEAIGTAAPVLAAGWSFLYLLFGGGIGGAVLIFIVLKMIGR
jgi:hypothetical protein